ncbi:hypothetical protein A2853_01340 [Candidatus Kaiserbacteria bacterium RIFCSPHIGHO2_01_FULL_55_17]|uniref:Glycerophosphoryl diester phosphodiesterase membrane domain-containing protein n=1 Tax=Candidatus Kaiserbacteria bacterium RIFCSPHIGHO2_01_FULL_55_17 TaxID=1798484 RepID=A0A1F6DAS7_9BACT|nr:MAG: hypothetical protein A2853_01340 [Candidatus Kaiserbacteria bacterium RIFCSPHIGHO2_01_FULL_55_17]
MYFPQARDTILFMNEFSVGACIRFGWETFKKRPWFVIGAVIISGLFSVSYSYKTSSIQEIQTITPFLFLIGLAYAAVSIAISILITRFQLKAHDSVETLKYLDTLPARPYWKFIGGKIAVGIVVAVGFILLIVPGIIAALAFIFTPYLIVERKLWPIEAMKESARITKGHRWQLFLLSLALIGLNILGALALFVGLLVSIPVSMLAMVHAYRILEKHAGVVAVVS